MRKSRSKVWRTVISSILAFSLAASMTLPAFASPNTQNIEGGETKVDNLDVNGDGEIKYVALGDSMTNGYGLPGYYPRLQKHYYEGHEDGNCSCLLSDGPYTVRNNLWGGNVFGYLANAPEAYPSLLADQLEAETGKSVNLLNMAISGMRTEELHVLLDTDYKGDGYTGKIFTNDNSLIPGEGTEPRFEWATAEGDSLGMSPVEAQNLRAAVQEEYHGDYSSLRGEGDNQVDNGTAKVRAEYATALKDAELITIALGTNNFGTGVQTSIYRAIEAAFGVTLGDVTNHNYDLDALLDEKPELRDAYESLTGMLYALIETQIPEVTEIFPMENIEDIVETYTYGLLGFMVHYEESLDLIREVNPDATIVVVGAMNMEEGIHFVIDGQDIDFGGIYGTIVETGNLWLADYVDGMENVYYSETENLSTLVDEMAEGKFNSSMLSLMSGDLADNMGGGSDQMYRLVAGLNTFGLDRGAEVLGAFAEYQSSGDLSPMLPFAEELIVAGRASSPDEATAILTDYVVAMTMLDAMATAAQDPYIDMDNVTTLFAGNGFAEIFSNPARLADEDVLDLLYFYARMMFASGAGVHPSTQGHSDIASEIMYSLQSEYTGGQKVDKSIDELVAWLTGYMQENNPELLEALNQAADYLGSEEFAALVGELKVIYEQLDGALTAEQEAALLEQLHAVQLAIQDFASKLTRHKYVVEEDSFYASLGDSFMTGYGLEGYDPGENNGEGQMSSEAPVLLAQKLFGDEWQSRFEQLAKGGLRAEDMIYFLDPSLEGDAYFTEYTMANTDYTRSEMRDRYVEAIEKADLISISIGGGNVSTFVGQQVDRMRAGMEPYDLDWSKYVQSSEELAELKADIEAAAVVLDAGLPEIEGVPSATLARVVVESFLYGCVSYSVNYPVLLDMIHEINPDALLVTVGYFNPVDDMVVPITIDGETYDVALGAAVGFYLETSNIQCLTYALANLQNTTFVAIPDTQTFLDEAIADGSAEGSFASYMESVFVTPWMTHASQSGHDYIAQQMYDALQEDFAADLVKSAQEAYEWLLAKAKDFVEKAPSAAAQWVYDWLYNNPDKVIAFFEEYGDEMIAFFEEYGDEILAVLGYVGVNYGEDIAMYLFENAETILTVLVELVEEYGDEAWALIDVYLEELGVYDTVEEAYAKLMAVIEAQIAVLEAELADLMAQLEAATGELKAQIEEQIALVEAEIEKLVQIAGSIEKFCQQVIETLSALYVEAKGLTEAAIADATHGEYAIDSAASYVALGDATIAVEGSYADQLAAFMANLAGSVSVQSDYEKVAISDEEDLAATVADILAAVESGELDEVLADAGFVTVSAGAEDMTVSIVYQLIDILTAYAMPSTDEAAALDWATYVGADGVKTIEAALAQIEAFLAEQICDEATITLAVDMIEAVAYGYAGFAVNYVDLLDAVQAKAPNAHVVAVGVANALEGLSLDINGFELAIGEYAGWVVKAADLEMLAYAALDEGANVTFVSASDASCDAAAVIAEVVEAALAIDFENDPEAVLDLIPYVSQIVDTATWIPNDEGQAYIAEQILGAVDFAAVADAVYTAEPAAPAVAGAATAASEAVEVTDEAVATVTFEDGCVVETTFAIEHLATVESFEDFGEPADGHWYLEEGQGSFAELRTLYMDYALATEIMSGYVNREDGTITHFGPWDSLDRAQAATVIYRMANADITATTDPAKYADNATAMADVEDGEYYTAAVNWCVENGIITGYEAGPKAGSFGPYDKVTREQLAAMIQRYCVNVCGAEMLYGDITAYDDYDEINGEWAVPGLQFCKAYGIMTGIYGTNDLNPAGNANRAEAAKMFSVVGHDIL